MPTDMETTDSHPWIASSLVAAPKAVVLAAIAVAALGLLATASIAERALSGSFIVLSFKCFGHRRDNQDGEPECSQ